MEEEVYKLKEVAKVNTKYIDFYREIKDKKKLVDHMHQLFTYACLVGIKEERKYEGSKPDTICNIGNIESNNLDVIKGIVLMKEDPENGEELLKLIQEYADGGIETLMTEYKNEGTLRLDKYI